MCVCMCVCMCVMCMYICVCVCVYVCVCPCFPLFLVTMVMRYLHVTVSALTDHKLTVVKVAQTVKVNSHLATLFTHKALWSIHIYDLLGVNYWLYNGLYCTKGQFTPVNY